MYGTKNQVRTSYVPDNGANTGEEDGKQNAGCNSNDVKAQDMW